ncbi:MAG TPA: YihY/virulence factor BrkB family protein [Actinomycetota bacterium]|nr:YihY/virulence factor BrkB family protein [Actinomycetota bacterium]
MTPAAVDRIKLWFGQLQRRSRLVDIVVRTFKAFSDDDGGTYAAALTYYTFFSIFPLLLFGAAILGYVTRGDEELQQQIITAGVDAVPMIRDVLKPAAIEAIVRRRQELAATGLVLALYSGSGAVIALQHGLNKMLGLTDEEPGWIAKRLKALRWLVLLGGCALLSVALGTLASYSAGLLGLGSESIAARLIGHVAGFLVGLVLFASAYKLLPAVSQTWRRVLPGAVVAAVLFEALKEIGAAYLESGSQSREATFGTLAAAAGLLVAAFFISQITLLAAELNGVLAEGSEGESGRTGKGGPR